MKKITLQKPLKVNGKEIKELPFDTSTFDARQLKRANKIAAATARGEYVIQETDYNLHFAIAQIIVETSSNGDISIEDLDRITGADLFTLQREGRNFLLESVVQDQENLEELAEVTQ